MTPLPRMRRVVLPKQNKGAMLKSKDCSLGLKPGRVRKPVGKPAPSREHVLTSTCCWIFWDPSKAWVHWPQGQQERHLKPCNTSRSLARLLHLTITHDPSHKSYNDPVI